MGSIIYFAVIIYAVLGLGLGLGLDRLGVRFSVNPDPKTPYFKKKLDPDSDPGPDRAFCSHPFKRVRGFMIEYA